MSWKWSKTISRANVGRNPFESAVGEVLQAIFEGNAGNSPKLYLEMPTTRWVLQGDATKKTVKAGRSPDRSPFKMDAFTIFGNGHILQDRFGNKTSAVVNFEFTTTQENGIEDYMVGKINYLSGIVDAHFREREYNLLTYPTSPVVSYRETLTNIRTNNDYPRRTQEDIEFSQLDQIHPQSGIKTMLIFITNNEQKRGTDASLSAKLGDPAVWNRATTVNNVTSGGNPVDGAFDVETPSGNLIRVGQINISELLDIVTSLEALEGTQPRFKNRLTDRFFWDMTRFSFGDDNALSMADNRNKRLKEGIRDISDFRAAGTQTFQVGPLAARIPITAEVYQFRMKQDRLIDLTQVERTMNNAKSLQRTAVKNHLKGMAISIQNGKRFHLPVILIADGDTDFNVGRGANRGLFANQRIFKPYGWRVIDGQHRLFSCYHKEVSATANNFEMDILMFKFTGGPTPEQIEEASGEIFYDVNYRGVIPPAEVALNHMAKMAKFPFGLEKKGSGAGKSKEVYSSRVHAMRFIQELNDNSRIFANKFDLFNQGLREGGLGGRKLLKPASITTYLAPHFEFGYRTTRVPYWSSVNKTLMRTYSNPAKFGGARHYFHEVPNGAGVMVPWGTVGATVANPSPAHQYGVPTPSELDAANFYQKLREDFDDFCERIQVGRLGYRGTPAGTNYGEAVLAWCMDSSISSSFLPALFRVFLRYYCEAQAGAPLAFANLDLTPGARIQRIGRAINALTMPVPAAGLSPAWPGASGGVNFFESSIIDWYNNGGAARGQPVGPDRIPV